MHDVLLLGANESGFSGLTTSAFTVERREFGKGFGPGKASTSTMIPAPTTVTPPSQSARRWYLGEENSRLTAAG